MTTPKPPRPPKKMAPKKDHGQKPPRRLIFFWCDFRGFESCSGPESAHRKLTYVLTTRPRAEKGKKKS